MTDIVKMLEFTNPEIEYGWKDTIYPPIDPPRNSAISDMELSKLSPKSAQLHTSFNFLAHGKAYGQSSTKYYSLLTITLISKLNNTPLHPHLIS